MKKLKEIKRVDLPDVVKKLNGKSAKKLKEEIEKLCDAVECEEDHCEKDHEVKDD